MFSTFHLILNQRRFFLHRWSTKSIEVNDLRLGCIEFFQINEYLVEKFHTKKWFLLALFTLSNSNHNKIIHWTSSKRYQRWSHHFDSLLWCSSPSGTFSYLIVRGWFDRLESNELRIEFLLNEKYVWTRKAKAERDTQQKKRTGHCRRSIKKFIFMCKFEVKYTLREREHRAMSVDYMVCACVRNELNK